MELGKKIFTFAKVGEGVVGGQISSIGLWWVVRTAYLCLGMVC